MAESSDMSVMYRMFKVVKPFWWLLLLGLIATVVVSGVDACAVWAIKPVINHGFVGRSHSFLSWLPVVAFFLFALRCVMSFFSTYLTQMVSRNIVRHFRVAIFNKYTSVPASSYDHAESGDFIAKIVYNIEKVSTFTQSTALVLVREGVYLLGLLAAMFIGSWRLSLLFVLVGPPLFYLMKLLSKKMRRYSTHIQTAVSDITSLVDASVRGYREVKLANMQQQEQSQFMQAAQYARQREMRSIGAGALLGSLTQFLLSVPLCIVLYLALSPSFGISVGAFASVLAAMMSLLRPVKRITAVNNDLQSGLAAAHSLFEVLQWEDESDAGRYLPDQRVKGYVQFKHVTFSYQVGQGVALKNVSIDIKPGQTVALVGRSGAGKTTLTNLLARFYFLDGGNILIDGVDINNYGLASLRSQLSYVSQNVFLFNDTIASNIKYGLEDQDISDTELERVASAACVTDFSRDLPDGLNTVIGQDGLRLSGGQRQRIAVARALIRSRPILVLDEATSALDSESELAIQQAISRLMEGRTTLVVAHRLSTIRDADWVVVMDRGEVVEQGTHEVLMSKNGYYHRLYNTQFSEEAMMAD